jgi:ADP-dependent NAD(P)H-hydrate dehydratase
LRRCARGLGSCRSSPRPDLAPGLGLAAPEARIIRIPASADGEFAEEGDDQLVDHAARCDAVIVGPGMMDQTAARRLTRRLLEGQGEARFVVDAAALTGLEASEARAAAGRLILTPHAGEMAALCGHSKEEVQARPLDIARDIAADYQSVVVMKGRILTWSARTDGPGIMWAAFRGLASAARAMCWRG